MYTDFVDIFPHLTVIIHVPYSTEVERRIVIIRRRNFEFRSNNGSSITITVAVRRTSKIY